jgi:hypothetical protein
MAHPYTSKLTKDTSLAHYYGLPPPLPYAPPTVPMSRERMKELRINRHEELRITGVNNLVTGVYWKAVQQAETTNEKIYHHPIPCMKYKGMSTTYSDFYKINMPEILSKLQELFPGCTVTHTLLAKGTDGKLYDISKVDDAILPLINASLENSYVVVDWS